MQKSLQAHHEATPCPSENNVSSSLAALAAHLEALVHLLLLEVAKPRVGVNLSQRVSLRKYHPLAAVGMLFNVVM